MSMVYQGDASARWGYNLTSCSIAKNVVSAKNLAVAGFWTGSIGSIAGLAATFGGVPMTQVESVADPDGAHSVCWILTNPPIGTQIFRVGWTSSLNTGVLGLMVFENVDQASPVLASDSLAGTDHGTDIAGITLASDADGFLANMIGHGIGTGTNVVGAGQTQRWGIDSTGGYAGYGSTEPGDGGNVAMTWTWAGGSPAPFAHVAMSLSFATPTKARSAMFF